MKPIIIAVLVVIFTLLVVDFGLHNVKPEGKYHVNIGNDANSNDTNYVAN